MADMNDLVNGLAQRLYGEAQAWCAGSGLKLEPWFQAEDEVRDAYKAAAHAAINGAG